MGLFIFLYVFFIFTNYLQQIYEGINFFDEILTLLGLAICFLYSNKKKLVEVNTKYAIRCIIGVLIIGGVATICFQIQPNFAGIWRDALAISKFPICYYAYSIYSKRVNLRRLQLRLLPISKICIIITFILGCLNLVYRIPFLYEGERYGLPLFNMGFSHATFLVAVVFMLIATLISSGFRKNIVYILMGCGCILFTLRSKPMLPLIFLAVVWMLRSKKNIKLTKGKIVLYALLIIFLTYYAAYSQITTYIGYGEEAARGACYFYGADIANNFFPLGSGFCTFSSSLSGRFYSPLYYYYDLEWMQGLTPDDYSYAADTFWPNIYSQYGWVGFGLYLLMLFYITLSVHRRFKPLSDQWIAGMLLLVYCAAAAFAEAIYTNDTSVIFAITLTCFIGENYENSTTVARTSLWRSRKVRSGSCK